MPREFIPNVDTANEEIERLDTRITDLTNGVASATANHQAAIVERDQARAELLTATQANEAVIVERDTARTELARTQGLLDVANRNAVNAAAAAGAPPVRTPSTEDGEARANSSSELTGTARVTAAIKNAVKS
jgi:hypothetical protein